MPRLGHTDTKTVQDMIDATLPWNIQITPAFTPSRSQGFSTISINASYIFCHSRNASGFIGDYMAWDLGIAKGTWSFELLFNSEVNRGILTLQIDQVEKATIDTYSATPTYNLRQTITGIIIPISKKIELKLIVNSKNPSSSAYYLAFLGAKLTRTA